MPGSYDLSLIDGDSVFRGVRFMGARDFLMPHPLSAPADNSAETRVACACCGVDIPANYGRDTVHGAVCDSCYVSHHYIRCASCHAHAQRVSPRLPEICFDCRIPARDCRHCGRVDLSGQMDIRAFGGECICAECYDSIAARCEFCDTTNYRETMTQHDIEGLICRNCRGWLRKRPNYVASNAFDETRSQRVFGVELETCDSPNGWDYSGDFTPKEDGSVNGAEFVSPPIQGDKGLEMIRDFCEDADAHQWRVNRSCGYHLHVDVSTLSVEQLKSVCLAYHAFEPVWLSFVPASRRRNDYCRRLDDDFPSSVRRLSLRLRDFSRWAGQRDRYRNFNVRAFAEHKSFEVRLHTGTLNNEKIGNWVKAHTRFVDYWASTPFAPELFGATLDGLAAIWKEDDLADFYLRRQRLFDVADAADDEDSGDYDCDDEEEDCDEEEDFVDICGCGDSTCRYNRAREHCDN